MKKTVLILTTILISFFSIQGQTLETIGSGVADFLLSNPKTADKMKPEHQVALSIIGNLLNTSGQRKHELNVANAGRTQMNFNTNSGQQIQLVSDSNGSVYALSNGTIYPISQSVVDEAKEYVLNQQPGYMDYARNNPAPTQHQFMLPDFDYYKIEKSWGKDFSLIYNKIKSPNNQTLKFLLNDLKLGENDIYVLYNGTYQGLRDVILKNVKAYLKKYRDGRKKLISSEGFLTIPLPGDKGRKRRLMYYFYLFKKEIKLQEIGLFTAKWFNDVNNNNKFEIDEFQDIRRNFYENEPFLIAYGLYSQNPFHVKLKIMNQLSGDVVYSQDFDNSKVKFDMGYFSFNGNRFQPGIYVYYILFIDNVTNKEIYKMTDKFQILALNQTNEDKEDKNIKTPSINQDIEKSSSKEDMINDLIQLLKDGKISEETFNASMKALEIK